ncbi:MAG: hypothetical protein ISR25_03670 [Candidatus Poseidoniaceae archaeon]|nr:hypothetical protein [Candidatus Poseidoniaceae archaeon]MBL6889571.1 hypothetical protein [Candidatus Poseidoniaceae archaeon]
MVKGTLRVIGVGQDIELRVVSFLTRARQVTDDVVFIDLGSKDETKILVEEIGCTLLETDENNLLNLTKVLDESNLEPVDNYSIININKEWSLREFPLHLNRSREGWDVYVGLVSDSGDVDNPSESILSESRFQHCSLSHNGLEELSKSPMSCTAHDLSAALRVRIVQSTALPTLPQRESLATASRFAQLFMWMIQSRHPLFLFGIPGLVLFVLGYRLSGGVVDTFTELTTESLGVTFATIAMTLFGLFAMMIALMLYIMGKQVEQIQAQYEWPNKE